MYVVVETFGGADCEIHTDLNCEHGHRELRALSHEHDPATQSSK